MGIEALLTVLSDSHEYVMLGNGAACAYLMVRSPKVLFNFYQLSSPADLLSVVAFLCLPLFYVLESIPTLDLCASFYLSACKYAVHHLLTTSVFLVMFQSELMTGPSYLVQATHGLMNFFYYHNHLLTYLFCQWYVASTVFCAVHISYHLVASYTPTKIRWTLGLALALMLAISINNSQTTELASLCELDENDSLERNLKVWFSHTLFFSSLAYLTYTTSRRCPLLPTSLQTSEAKYY